MVNSEANSMAKKTRPTAEEIRKEQREGELQHREAVIRGVCCRRYRHNVACHGHQILEYRRALQELAYIVGYAQTGAPFATIDRCLGVNCRNGSTASAQCAHLEVHRSTARRRRSKIDHRGVRAGISMTAITDKERVRREFAAEPVAAAHQGLTVKARTARREKCADGWLIWFHRSMHECGRTDPAEFVPDPFARLE